MNRVLIIGPNFHYFNESISRAFQSLGWETHVDAYDTPIHPYGVWNKLRYKVGDKTSLKLQSCLRYDNHIRNLADEYTPDLVFVLNGENLSSHAVTYLHQKAKVVFWLFDSITRMPSVEMSLPFVDQVYCYEQSDISYIKEKLNIDACFLPQAVDTSLYYPIKGIEKKFDIVFAGEIWSSCKRQKYLNAVITHFPNKRIRIVGRYKIPTKGFFAWLFRKNRQIFTNHNASAEELNRLYNEARVVLNIHHEQQKNGANPKVYEILAAGAHQVCDSNPYLLEHFSHFMDLYTTEEQMLLMIESALNKPYESNREIVQGNTFKDRVEEVISNL